MRDASTSLFVKPFEEFRILKRVNAAMERRPSAAFRAEVQLPVTPHAGFASDSQMQ